LRDALKTAAELFKLKALDEAAASLVNPIVKQLQSRQVAARESDRKVPQQHREVSL